MCDLGADLDDVAPAVRQSPHDDTDPAPAPTKTTVSRTSRSSTTGRGDHDRFAHYVRKADIVRANVEGVEVVAICGKKWIPNRDPSRYPICPTCKELKARLSRGNN